MKKGLIYLFMLVMGAIAFTACNDEDTAPKKISHEYSGDNLKMTLNGTAQTAKAVQLEALNKENGYLSLKKMIPGEDSLVINVKLEQSSGNNFAIDGTSTNNDRTISVTGEVKEGIMTLNSTFKITSGVVGNWICKPQDWMTGAGPIYLEITTDIDSINFPILGYGKVPVTEEDGNFVSIVQFLGGMMLPMYLGNIELKNNGNLIATYFSPAEGSTMPDQDKPLKNEEGLVRYNVSNGQIYIAVDINSLLARSTGQTDLLGMLSNGIPLKLKLEENNMTAYVDREMMLPFMGVLELLKPLIETIQIPEEISQAFGVTPENLIILIDEVINLVKNSQEVKLGLNFIPAEQATPSTVVNAQMLKENLMRLRK